MIRSCLFEEISFRCHNNCASALDVYRCSVLLICSLVVRARFSCLPFLEYISESPTASTNDLKRFENSLSALESPPPRYHTLQGAALLSLAFRFNLSDTVFITFHLWLFILVVCGILMLS